MRLLISVLGPILAIALLSACDRQKPQAPQGGEPPAAPISGKGVDRSHAGSPVPTAKFRDPDGEPATLARFKGKPLLVNLWATWCAPCVKELPTLDTLAGTGGRLQVLTLSQDMSEQAKVRGFLDEHKLAHLEAWQDPEMAVSGALGVQVLPATLLYGSDGKEIWRYNGELDWMGAEAKRLLAEAN